MIIIVNHRSKENTQSTTKTFCAQDHTFNVRQLLTNATTLTTNARVHIPTFFCLFTFIKTIDTIDKERL